jgi:hypothetical protein
MTILLAPTVYPTRHALPRPLHWIGFPSQPSPGPTLWLDKAQADIGESA